MSLPCIPRDIACNPYHFVVVTSIDVSKIVCLTHDMLQSVIVSGVVNVICHISNVNGVLQYTRISALVHCII